ncbi:XRE family transcriptional regulator [Streptococcus sp. zg-JUN1979]|uniref:XRE family transcriptional regulator n=1 Tax=Streptococcus sp. zg-JUN1979 TaxID=3391450 RepID=UPI0039A6EB48
MSVLSAETEQAFSMELLAMIDNYIKARDRPHQRVLGLMTAEQVKHELDVSHSTLLRWEELGLKRYSPPLEDSRKVFYKVSDILIFLGVDDD